MSGPVTNIHTSGRCKSGRCQARSTAFMWPKRLMRLVEATCPRCGRFLSQTSRDYRPGFRELTGDEIVAMLDRRIAWQSERYDNTARQANDDTADEFTRSLARHEMDRIARSLKDVRARRGRAAKHAAQQRQEGATA